MNSKNKAKKSIKTKKLDFQLLNNEESEKIVGSGINYCPNNPDSVCCQAIPNDGPGGGWVCPH